MNDANRRFVQTILQRALPPTGEFTLEHDLWSRMARRLERPARPVFTWLDLLLASLAAAGFFAFPEAIPVVLFHL